MRSFVVRLLAPMMILTAICQPAAAQPPVSVSIAAGVGQNGAADSTEAMLRAAGLDGNGVNWFSDDPITHPKVKTEATWVGADIRVRIRPTLSVGLFFSQSAPAAAWGYQGEFLNDVNLSTEASLTTISPVVSYHPLPRLRLGIGPALYRMTFDADAREASYRTSENKLGWSAHAGFAVLNRSRIYSELTLQYLGAPSLTTGGFVLESAPAYEEQVPIVIFVPLSTIDYRRLAIGISFGVKLG